jgi:hypothetical protein
MITATDVVAGVETNEGDALETFLVAEECVCISNAVMNHVLRVVESVPVSASLYENPDAARGAMDAKRRIAWELRVFAGYEPPSGPR